MAVSEGKGLAVNGDGDVPGPQVLDVLAVSLGGVVELLEVVGLPVGGDIEGRQILLATDKEDTLDDAGVVGTEDSLGTEEVLAGSLQTGVEATDQVVGHEGELELLVVLVVNLPEGVLFGLVVLPEPGEGNGTGVLVGVLALPLIEDEGGLAKGLEGVLGLGGGGGLLSRGSGSGGSSGLGLLLLLGGSVLDDLLGEDGGGDNGLEGGLVDDGVVPAGDGGVLRAELLVENGGKGTGQEGGSEEISQGDALANQVGVGSEVLLEDGTGLQGNLGGLIDGLLVVAVEAEERAVPSSKLQDELAVGKGHPADNGSIVLLGLAEESGLLVLGGDYNQNKLVEVFWGSFMWIHKLNHAIRGGDGTM